MRLRFATLAFVAALAGIISGERANSFTLDYSRGVNRGLERIRFITPVLAPFAHARFCLQYPDDCKVHHVIFRGGKLAMTAQRRTDLATVNAEVNRSIRPEPNLDGVVGEKWLISPESGDCNDYAVTKRHELIARGWPARSLLLAEVILPSREHHLVVVVRAREGDLVIDNLSADIRPWFSTPYRWVRIQSPTNPNYWSTMGRASA